MTRQIWRRGAFVLLTAAGLFLAGGCSGTDWAALIDQLSSIGRPGAEDPNETKPEPTDGKSTLQRFNSADELLTYLRENAASGSGYGLDYARDEDTAGMAPTAAETGSSNSDATAADGGGQVEFSTTNIQEEGVDESDVLKSDGTYFYLAKGKGVRIIQAVPSTEMAEIAQVDLSAAITDVTLDRVDSLYLNGSHLIALATGGRYTSLPGGVQAGPAMMEGTPARAQSSIPIADPEMWSWYLPAVIVIDVDITDPTHPTIVAQNSLEGGLISSRLTNGRLIVVLSLDVLRLTYLAQSAPEDLTLDQALPQALSAAGSAILVPAENWYRSTAPYSYGVTAVVTLPADNVAEVAGAVAVLAGAGTVYASTEAVYLAETSYSYDEATGYGEATSIHKLAFNDQQIAEYAASGVVPGSLLNQYSLGEYNGNLRVATHIGQRWFADIQPGVSPIAFDLGGQGTDSAGAEEDSSGGADAGSSGDSSTAQNMDDTDSSDVVDTPLILVDEPTFDSDASNSVFVLTPDGTDLKVAGKIEGLAPGERLYAARFLGDHGFLVTFRQIDPLFVLDLSDPTAPRSVGELKVEGYSDYLHPIGDHLLLGIGRSTAAAPWGGVTPAGLQLTLFNVSDWTNPTVIGQPLVLGGLGSSSDVSYNPKAFAILPDAGLIAIPAQLMADSTGGDDWDYGYAPEFDGAICCRLSETEGVTVAGRVASVIYEDYYYWTEWRRPAFIGDALYAVTPAGVRAAPTNAFDSLSTLVLVPSVDESSGGVKDAEATDGSTGQ